MAPDHGRQAAVRSPSGPCNCPVEARGVQLCAIICNQCFDFTSSHIVAYNFMELDGGGRIGFVSQQRGSYSPPARRKCLMPG
jgi:hypothetical protein